MRVQISETETVQAIGELLDQQFAPGTVLTITAPKSGVSRECECGCGGRTSGGLWVPGHDAKHKSRLFHLVRGSDSEQRELASAELLERGWGLPSSTRKTHVAPLPVPSE